MHIDGARIFNAAVKLGVPVSRLAAYGGLGDVLPLEGAGLPGGLGALRVARASSPRRAATGRCWAAGCGRRASSRRPGSTRCRTWCERLAEDHENAASAGERAGRLTPGVSLAPAPETNLLYFTVDGWKSPKLERRLNDSGVLCFDEGGRIRWVTHYGIERADIDEALARTRDVLAAKP